MNSKESFDFVDDIVATDNMIPICDEYVRHCKAEDGRLPNMAGFFRWLRFGAADLDHFRTYHKDCYRTIMMIFEDETINSSRPPSLVSSYLKQYFRSEEDGEVSESSCGPITLVFDHDIDVDGA